MDLPRRLTITVPEVADAPTNILREWIPQFMGGKPHRKVFTLGLMLYRVKTEKLFVEWGHETFWKYCRNEGKVHPTNSENWRISFYAKYKSLGFSHEDMQELQGRGHPLRILRRIHQLCSSKEEVEATFADFYAIDRLRRRTKKLGYEPVKLGFVNLVFTATEYEIVHSVLDTLNRRHNINERRGILAVILLCKVLMQTPKEGRYAELKRLCLYHGIHEDFVTAVMGEEKWKDVKI